MTTLRSYLQLSSAECHLSCLNKPARVQVLAKLVQEIAQEAGDEELGKFTSEVLSLVDETSQSKLFFQHEMWPDVFQGPSLEAGQKFPSFQRLTKLLEVHRLISELSHPHQDEFEAFYAPV